MRRVRTRLGDKVELPCSYFTWLIVFGLLFFCGTAIFSVDSYAWISATVTIPVQWCTNGTRMPGEYSRFSVCTEFDVVNQTFFLMVNPFRPARISTRSNIIISSMKWSDLTGENVCTPNSDILTKYGEANNLCVRNASSPTLSVPVNGLPTYIAGIICFTFLMVYLPFSCLAIEGSHRPLYQILALHILMILCVISCAYGLAFWQNLTLVRNYFADSVESYAPMLPGNVSLMGFAPYGSEGLFKEDYIVTLDSTSKVLQPVLVNKLTVGDGQGYKNFVVVMVGVAISWAMIWLDNINLVYQNKLIAMLPRPLRAPRRPAPPPPPAIRDGPRESANPTTSTTQPQSEVTYAATLKSQDVPRPNREAPVPPPNDMTDVDLAHE